MPRAAEHLADAVGRWVLDQPRVFYPAKERLERGVDFQPGQRTAEADVNAAAPAHMLVVGALRVERVRGRGSAADPGWPRRTSDRWVMPRGIVVPAISMSANADRVGKNCTDDCSRSTSSMAPGINSGLLRNNSIDHGVAQHGQHAVRDQIDRRVMTGDEQQDGVVDDRTRRHLPVRSVIVDQLRNHARAQAISRPSRPARRCIR